MTCTSTGEEIPTQSVLKSLLASETSDAFNFLAGTVRDRESGPAGQSSMEPTPHARIAGIAAVAISVTSFVFIIILAADLTTDRQRLYILALAGAIMQGILLCTLSHLLIRYGRGERKSQLGHGSGRGERRTTIVMALGILPSIVAASVVGAALVWSKANGAEQPSKILGSRRATFLTVGIISWAMAVLTQAIFYVSLLRTETVPKKIQHLDNHDEGRIYPQMMETSQPAHPTAQSNQIQALPASSPSAPSLVASEGTSSLRSSLSLIQRPAITKPRLLIRQHSFPRQSNRFLDHPAPERWSHGEGFDSWDTSEVAPHIREAILQSSPVTRGKPLEPIPGSRSPSPAKALEGPFYPEIESSSVPTSPLPQPTYSRTSSRQQPHGLDISLYRQGQSSSAPSSPLPHSGSSRPGSRQRAVSNEAHIHPLFRTCSLIPPPTASSKTVLTAAPEAGQVMSGRAMQRMRSGSLPSTTTALIRSHSFDTYGAGGSRNQDVRPMPEVIPLLISPTPPLRIKKTAGLASSCSET